jgi:hypothetical protein
MTAYKICLQGHLDRRWETLFEGFTITHQVTPEKRPITVMSGEVADQAALFGLLSRFRDLGVALISFQPQESEP